MAKIEHYHTKFEAGKFYHIYNRAIDRQPMFKSAENYAHFLRRFDFYLAEVIEVYAYCLLDNHFHFLIRVTDNLAKTKSNLELSVHEIVSKQFRLFF